MEEPPEKQLRVVSFVLHATRGVVRDQNARRKIMFALLVLALVLLASGWTFLASFINPREHPAWFILFWLGVAWLTLTAMLIALFDVLVVRSEARRAERRLRQEIAEREIPGSSLRDDA
jgi:hypothetical protein